MLIKNYVIMRKLLLLLLVLPLLFISCSDDDNDLANSEIVGVWVTQSFSAKEVKTNTINATKAIKDDIESMNEGDIQKLTAIFSNDGKLTLTDYDDNLSGTYSLTGDMLTMVVGSETQVVPISLSGNTLKVHVDQTEYYKDVIDLLLPYSEDVVVSKVIETTTLKRK